MQLNFLVNIKGHPVFSSLTTLTEGKIRIQDIHCLAILNRTQLAHHITQTVTMIK